MRRILFYLSVALLSFGIGSFGGFSFYWSNSSEIAVMKAPTKIKFIEQNTFDQTLSAKFSCEDQATKTVWSKLEKDNEFMTEIYPNIEENNCQEVFVRQQIDLNNDNSDEIILRGVYGLFCGSSGDCPTWIVSKINNEYKIIFETSVGESPEGLQFLRGKTNKFKNIKIKLNNGWEADNFGFFNFDGNQYRIKKCFVNVNSAYDYDDLNKEKLNSVKLEECL